MIDELVAELPLNGALAASVVSDSGRVEGAAGYDALGVALGKERFFAAYCATKPVLAIAFARLAEQGVLSLEDPIAKHLPHGEAPAFGQATIADVLSRRAGMHAIRGALAIIAPPADRREVVSQSCPPEGFEIGVSQAYAEFTGWWLLGRILERVTSRSEADALRELVLGPAGLGDIIVFEPPGAHDDFRAVVAVSGRRVDGTMTPLLIERGLRLLRDPNSAALGGYATLRGLALLGWAVVEALDGRSPWLSRAAAARMLEPRVPLQFDPVLERRASFGCGWMVDLGRHGFGASWNVRSFGHAGFGGALQYGADPDLRIAIAVAMPLVDNPVVVTRLWRAVIFDRIIEAMEH